MCLTVTKNLFCAKYFSLASADPRFRLLHPSSLPQEADLYGLHWWDVSLSDFCLAWPVGSPSRRPQGSRKARLGLRSPASLPAGPSLTSHNPKPMVRAPPKTASLPNSPSGFQSLFTPLGLGYHLLTVTSTPPCHSQSPESRVCRKSLL